jgi:hypothetical protein
MEIQERRRSNRSISIDKSILLLNEIILNKSIDCLDGYVINNTLPDEIRIIAWKIFLGILPVDNPNSWVEITVSQRDKYQNILFEDEIVEVLKNIQLNEFKNEEFSSVFEEINKLKNKYDFFKSQIVGESLFKLFVIYLKLYKETFENTKWAFYILAGLIYILYPSVMPFTCKLVEISTDPKWLLYYMNDEEHFDCDIFSIFDNLMNHKQLRHISFTKAPRQDILDIEDKVINNIDMEFIAKLNPYERVSYYYLRVINPNLARYLFSIKLDLYDIFETWTASLLTSTIDFERLTYFWDNVFYRCEGDRFGFLDLVNVALVNNLSEDLLAGNIVSDKAMLMRYPEVKLDEKEIIKKALKLYEKLNE